MANYNIVYTSSLQVHYRMSLLGIAVTEQVEIGFRFSYFMCFWTTGRAGRGILFRATSGINSLSFTLLHDSIAKLRKGIIVKRICVYRPRRLALFKDCLKVKHNSFLVSQTNGQVESFSFSISFKTVQGRDRVTCCVLLPAEVKREVILFFKSIEKSVS